MGFNCETCGSTEDGYHFIGCPGFKDVESERRLQDEVSPSIGDGRQPDDLAGVRQIADRLRGCVANAELIETLMKSNQVYGKAWELLEINVEFVLTDVERRLT